MSAASRTREIPGEAPRARSVPDLPIDALLERTDELAKRWAIALILARTLESLGEVPLEDLSREAPSLCAQVLRALQADVELERLAGREGDTGVSDEPGGRERDVSARRLSAIVGARNVHEAIEAVEALRGVLWEALLEELRWQGGDRAHARQVGDLCDRLAYVCTRTLAATIDSALAPKERIPALDEREAHFSVSASGAGVGAPMGAPIGARAVIVDESAGVQIPAAGAGAPREDAPRMSIEVTPVEIEVRDERVEAGPAAWIGSIGRQLEHFEQDSLPFAVLLVELLDIERPRATELSAGLSRSAERVQEVLTAELQASSLSGSLTSEVPGRYWLVIPQTDRLGAFELSGRLTRAVARSVVNDREAPLEIVVGAAACPEDGRDAPALAAHADVGLYAARSAARRAATVEPA